MVGLLPGKEAGSFLPLLPFSSALQEFALKAAPVKSFAKQVLQKALAFGSLRAMFAKSSSGYLPGCTSSGPLLLGTGRFTSTWGCGSLWNGRKLWDHHGQWAETAADRWVTLTWFSRVNKNTLYTLSLQGKGKVLHEPSFLEVFIIIFIIYYIVMGNLLHESRLGEWEKAAFLEPLQTNVKLLCSNQSVGFLQVFLHLSSATLCTTSFAALFEWYS